MGRSLLGSLLNRAPIPYSTKYGATAPPRVENSTSAQLAAMGAVGTLFAIVDKISEETGQTDWCLNRIVDDADDRGDTPPPKVTRHAAWDLWQQPNPFHSGGEFRHTQQQYFELCGEHVTVVARLGRVPVELWPVRPDRIAPVPHRTKFIQGWIYYGPDGEEIPLDVDDVIQVKRPNPTNPYRGLSPVVSLLTDIGATKAAAEWHRNFFVNSALPGGIVEFERRLGDIEWQEFTTRWRDAHKGVGNAHRVATIEGGGKWVGRAFSMRDMQFEELRNVPRELIREAFAFPKPLLGTVDDVNRANAEAGEHMFTRHTLEPRLHRWREMGNGRILPLFKGAERRVEFNYPDVTIVDADAQDRERASKATAAAAYVQAGYHPDDVLDTLALPKMRYVGPPDTGPAEKDDKQSGGQSPNSDSGGGKQKRSNGSSNRTEAELTVRDMVRGAVEART